MEALVYSMMAQENAVQDVHDTMNMMEQIGNVHAVMHFAEQNPVDGMYEKQIRG
jgi:hypothetical protein